MVRTTVGCTLVVALSMIGCSSSPSVSSTRSDIEVVGSDGVVDVNSPNASDPPRDEPVPELSGPLTIQLDGNVATERIGADGGTIEVTSATGTLFSLVVPPGALIESVDITATAVAEFGNLGFDAHGVVFGPAGLSFAGVGELTITPTDPVPVERQLMFAFDDTGSQFGAAEPKLTTDDVVVMVGHFSGYGFGDASRPSQAAFLERQASEAAVRIAGQVGDIFHTERISELLAVDSTVDLAAVFEEYATQWEEQVIKPRLAAGGSSCAAADLAISTVIGYERQRALIGAPTSTFGADLGGLVQQGYAVCEEEAITKCKAAKEPSILLEFWLGANRRAQLLGSADIAPTDPEQAKVICSPAYAASGGQPSFELSGTVTDLTKAFTLNGTFLSAPWSVAFTFLPDDASSGSHLYEGGGDGAVVSASGSYTIAAGDDGVLILTTSSGNCTGSMAGIGDVPCQDSVETIILTPI